MPPKGKRKLLGVCLTFLLTLFLAGYLAGKTGLFKGGFTPISSKKIAVVFVEGMLQDPRDIVETLDGFRERKDVKAIVMRIECPGGAVGAAQEVYGEMRKLREEKILLASLGNLAASGGYYIASAAQEIVANPGTLTGSIGVISDYPNFQDLMKKIGYKAETLKSGRYKDLGNPMREMTREEVGLVQKLMDNIHAQFIRDVATGRNQGEEQIRALADGRLYTGEQAKEVGLIDRLGNFQDALDRAAELAGIEGKPVVLYPPQRKVRIWEFLFRGMVDSLLEVFQRVLITT